MDFLLAIIQDAETFIDLIYFFKFSFSNNIFYYISLAFLGLNPISQYFYANVRLCAYEGCFKIYVKYRKCGFFYEKVKITDCGYFSHINARASEISLVFLYLFAPVVMALLFVELMINLAYVMINWVLSLIFYVFSVLFITLMSTVFCTVKLDLFLYPACSELVALFYFISQKTAVTTNDKMLSTKKTCIILQILFETIPLSVIYIINDKEMGYFDTNDLFSEVVVWLHIGLASANIFISFLQIITLAKYVKVANSPYEKILRASTNQNISKKNTNTDIIVIQSLDVIPEKN